jgi:two-component system chemotaxis response regulator CheB
VADRGSAGGNGGVARRDLVVVGASAGGVEALIRLVRDLPSDFPAAIFVVLHLPPGGKSHLPHILGRAGNLDTASAEDGEPIEAGRIYVGPPDCHLLVEDGHVQLGGGPKENGHRPAIDPLFRSAARFYGSRVIAVVLSGTLDDGTAGLRVVRASGGMTVVQDPDDALYPAMPLNAIAGARPEHVVPLADMPALLTNLTRAPVEEDEMRDYDDRKMESDYAILPPDLPEGEPPGEPSGFTCPECGGALWELEEGELTRYRCRVGHAYSAASLLAEHSDALEAALWTGYRALEERAAMAKRLADRLSKRGQARTAQRFENQVSEAEAQARTLREVLLGLQALPDTAPALEEQAAASEAKT